jgi:hypothetical protein
MKREVPGGEHECPPFFGFEKLPPVVTTVNAVRWAGAATAVGSSLFLSVGAQMRLTSIADAVVEPKRSIRLRPVTSGMLPRGTS